ncbi:MAG: tRNA (N(6)-L-threonylcarbamoyladenosine(37)-C(2))-methylthiotransferase MtaB [Firmicutes bacterium]|nr:tRNA (N(6)-L-threonylcarbamoyladenosine(37)-C(2))-methylthiotransferase MtaB [Bacillota bacterium]
MKAAFATLGCKVNQYETQALKELFRSEGYDIAAEDEPADVCVVNTCSVTNMADRKSRQTVRHFKKMNPNCVIVVTGCYAQTGKETVRAMDEVDIVAGTNEKSRIPELVRGFIEERKKIFDVLEYEKLGCFDEMGIVEAMEGRTRAYIKIQEGCNRFCSYCIIPYARGNVRSRKEEDILKEAELLINRGYKELVLTGINTALYGSEDDGEPKLHILIDRISQIKGDFRIRLSSLEPTVINSEYIKKLFEFDRLCHHVHLSVQSGSDNILRKMKRRYDMTEYRDIVTTIKEFDENYGITTDIIVGFPGEENEDFLDSVKTVEDIDFCKVHVFKYSRRGGTPADKMPDQIPPQTKNERSDLLIKAAEMSAARFVDRNIGTVRSVLFEEYDNEKSVITGLADNYIRAYVEMDEETAKNAINSFGNVLLEKRFLDGIKGILI